MNDKYTYNIDRYGVFYNNDPDCREKRSLDKDKEYIVIYNGENAMPYILEVGVDEFDTYSLTFESTVRSVYGTPKWGLRARSAIFDFGQNGLIFMMPEAMTVEEMSVDWKVMLMLSIGHIVQED